MEIRKGLICSESMCRAWMAGRKTVMRELVKLPEGFKPGTAWAADLEKPPVWFDFYDEDNTMKRIKASYRPGETVYIKETWAQSSTYIGHLVIGYKADKQARTSDRNGPIRWMSLDDNKPLNEWKWKSPRFMPEWASRSHALIVSVKPERVQEITPDECRKEGMMGTTPQWDETYCSHDADVMSEFVATWESLHKGSWAENSWIWRIELEKKPWRSEHDLHSN